MSAYEQPGFKIGTLRAGSTMTGKQYYGVVVSASTRGYFALASDEEQPILGVLQNEPGQGEVGEIVVTGVSKIYTDGSVVQGSEITCTASGVFTVATSTEFRNGWCIDGPTSTGSTGRILTGLIKALDVG